MRRAKAILASLFGLPGDPVIAPRAIRRVVESADPNVPMGEDMSMAEQLSLEYMPVLSAEDVMCFCGLPAVGLSAMGLYGILAFAVRTRTRELGIRMALGARREGVLRMVVGQGTRLALLGVATGRDRGTGLDAIAGQFVFWREDDGSSDHTGLHRIDARCPSGR